METGSRLRLQAEGESGPHGGPPGDLYVVIHVAEHEQFERRGNNLYTSIPITFAQAALGAEVNVITLSGISRSKYPREPKPGPSFGCGDRECRCLAAVARATCLFQFR